LRDRAGAIPMIKKGALVDKTKNESCVPPTVPWVKRRRNGKLSPDRHIQKREREKRSRFFVGIVIAISSNF
jgi:hypothetical protein